MNDKAFEVQRKRVAKYVVKWRKILGLGEWNVTTHYKMGDGKQHDTGYVTMLNITVEWMYKSCCINAYVEELATQTDDWIERAVVHEFCHALIAEMHNWHKDPDHEESVVTNLTNAIWWAYNDKKRK